MKQPIEHNIVVTDRHIDVAKGRRVCVLGEDVSFDKGALERATYTPLEDIDTDLLVVIAAIAYVDRLISRRRGTQWGRILNVTLPVYFPELWEHVRVSLATLLRMLTGDAWTLQFVQRKKRNEMTQEFLSSLSPDFAGSTVIPYSGGLDSFAMLARLQHEAPAARVLLVNARRSSRNEGLARPSGVSVIGVPFEFQGLIRPEESYRTRTFTYFSLAALAWRRNSGRQILIGESGIGCLGPALVPFGIEQPVRGSHPSFTASLSEVLGALWGSPPSFWFPHLWQTKGMVLTDLAQAQTMLGWEATRSCSRNFRRQHPGAPGTHCGLCTGCLFRRVALNAASFPHECQGAYFEDIITSSALSDQLTAGDRELAICAVIAIHELALLAGCEQSHAEMSDLASSLVEPVESVAGKVQILIGHHRDEWEQFVARLPSDSWVHPILANEVESHDVN
jgi:hypothetical protein